MPNSGCRQTGSDPTWPCSRRQNRTTMRVRRVGTSNRSECTRGLEMPGAYLPVSHTAPGDGGIDSAIRTYVPRPTAIAPARYHVPYCALRAGAGCGGRAAGTGFAAADYKNPINSLIFFAPPLPPIKKREHARRYGKTMGDSEEHYRTQRH